MSEDYLGSGLTFNALCPGYVDMEIVTHKVAAISDRAKVSKDEALWLCHDGPKSANGQTKKSAGGQF